jgi:hypothetical protein
MHTPAAAARRAFYVREKLRAVKAAAKAPEKGGLGAAARPAEGP